MKNLEAFLFIVLCSAMYKYHRQQNSPRHDAATTMLESWYSVLKLEGLTFTFHKLAKSFYSTNRANPANTGSLPGFHYIEFLHISDGIEVFHKKASESQCHLITAGCVTVKLKSPIRLVFVALRCGQFCHSSWVLCNTYQANCLCSPLKYRVAPPRLRKTLEKY